MLRIDRATGIRYETHLSTQPNQAGTNPWFPCPNGHARWPQGVERPPREGPQASSPLRSAGGSHRIRHNGFPKAARLLTSADFSRVFADPVRSADRYFTVLAVGGRADARARLGLAVSKKQARRAVDRNRLKRLIRETFRSHPDHLPGTDLVVMVRELATSTDLSCLRDSLIQHFDRLAERLARPTEGT